MKVIFSKTSDKITLAAKLSEDKMKLFVDVAPVEGAMATREDLLSLIKEFASRADINEGVLDDILKYLHRGEKVDERRIAKGNPSVDGSDGKILFLVKKFTGEIEVQEDSKGYKDLTNLHLFDNVAKGQTVGRIYGPKPGTDGADALGNKVPAKAGKPVKVAVDKTLQIKEEKSGESAYQVLVAQEEGYLFEESGKVSIKQELSVSGDLDYRFGSLDFVGKVIVKGDVLQGFNIKAGKGIEVSGSIRGGSLISVGGDIVVRGFVYGGKDSRIICGKSFTANVAHDVNAEIVGDITIQKEAIGCRLRSESSVYVKNGQLAGGETYSVCGVEAKLLGNQANTETRIVLCSDVETHTDFARLSVDIESHEKAKSLLEMHLGPLASNPSRMQLLRNDHREKMYKLYAKLQEVEKSRVNLLAKKKKMLEGAKLNPTMRVNYVSLCYEGVQVKAGDEVYIVKENLKGPGTISYHGEKKNFEVGSYLALECEYNKTTEGVKK